MQDTTKRRERLTIDHAHSEIWLEGNFKDAIFHYEGKGYRLTKTVRFFRNEKIRGLQLTRLTSQEKGI